MYVSIALGKLSEDSYSAIHLATNHHHNIYSYYITLPLEPTLFMFSLLSAVFQSPSLGILSFAVKDSSQTMTIFNMVRFPTILLSGVIIPISQLPAPLGILSYILPFLPRWLLLFHIRFMVVLRDSISPRGLATRLIL